MTKFRTVALACAISALALNGAYAQTAPAPAAETKEFKPYSGQEGKDVVWVPTPEELVERMLDMAKITKDDYVIDLGSGDGRTVITAAKRGTRAHGIEYNPDMVALSQRNAQKEGVTELATFVQGDIFKSDFSKATVITLFLLPTLNVQLRPTLLDMKPGTRVVSNTFDMGDWEPDDRIDAGGDCKAYCRAMKWVIPAKVSGTWRVGEGELKLTQKYQMLTGDLTVGGKAQPISDAKMDGSKITFTAGGRKYSGDVAEDKMSGQVDGADAWTATRTSKG
ncbi:MAG: class I SAM-dependent methyltransferase [Pseudolabrys sp.]|nr:class I SAM-dependent methyltransferase [Pseudolabrys sp.]